MKEDPESRVACETVVNTGLCLLTGEITSRAKLDYIKLVRNVIKEIGYEGSKAGGFDSNSCAVLVALDEQSPDISQGVSSAASDVYKRQVLDALLTEDPESRVACETVVNTGLCLLTGEITSRACLLYTSPSPRD